MTLEKPQGIAKEIAEILDGSEYGDEFSAQDIKYAKDNGAVIVFGASDDLVEFRGAIDDEMGCYGTGTIYFDRRGELRNLCRDDSCPYFNKTLSKANKIKAIWDAEGYSWVYELDIPHETFEILEDGEKYCRGIVFSIDDLKDD